MYEALDDGELELLAVEVGVGSADSHFDPVHIVFRCLLFLLV